MPRPILWLVLWLARLAATGSLAGAAALPAAAVPLPPLGAEQICGVVEAHHWLAPLTLPGTPGLSGSAGRTRSWPGRAVVLLGAVSGPEYDRMEQINRVLATSADGRVLQPGPGQLLLILPMQDPSQIEGAGRLCVTGFSVRGDEGGTWTGYREIELSPR